MEAVVRHRFVVDQAFREVPDWDWHSALLTEFSELVKLKK